MKILVEEMPYLSSISVGVWIVTGSREEEKNINGVSHFIEHMLFKGTKKRNASEIAWTLDRVGGRLNAFTSKEITCYHATVLKEHFSLALDLLSDILFNSLFKEGDIEKEKQVIVEEINLYEDSPTEHINDLLVQTIFPQHPLGQPISGKREAVIHLKRDEILKHFRGHYTPDRFVISVAGNIGPNETEKAVKNFFSGKLFTSSDLPTISVPSFNSNIKVFLRDLNQVHLCIGTPGIPHAHDERYIFSILNLILGGGMSSRLFQKIREKHGLVYAIYSYLAPFRDTGYSGIYAGTNPENFFQVLELIFTEMVKLKEEGVKDDELSMAKEHMKGGFLLSLESSDARMSRLASSEIYLDRIISIDEVLKKIDEVTLQDIRDVANKYFKKELLSTVTLGPKIDEDKIQKTIERIM
ncbi:hypothetical protein AUJ66_00730 [Candidatus Desantisbacteria bacterium CG1_02_38_46]|uniref:Peptidase M16 n=3 Tax=unclassified Candidatus Desantisiibacteriota TaxID=3106372 RepID=A0A2H9PC40_9BACT|nr:MAG: hypothetical protein AUJ66_00730 [Candidatus Desantisbacteria bacterium CG1_02_38_46]PIU51067.1 MAG: peptidase M16 [Candidatus Desantisbacteria bacterium CG07_land_8_20_14_0_80_39_15]PIZ16609.1 MAG: peptidase M16 [Candidatus Desantisbacteria bacterium CG_4_10_14_0_8_um_filter_39_17]